MKIMHINCSDHGSTGKIIQQIAMAAQERDWESVLCVPRIRIHNNSIRTYSCSMRYEQGVYKRFCYFGALRYGFAPLSTIKIINKIKAEQPDIVHLHSINCNMVNIYRLLRFLKKNKIPTVITNHAEFFYTGSCAHANECQQWVNGCRNCPSLYSATLSKTVDRTAYAWKKMKNAFSSFEPKMTQIVSVSPWVNERSQKSVFLGKLPNMTIKNGIDTSVFRLMEDTGIREKYHIPREKKIVLHVTAQFTSNIEHPKGGYYILKLAEFFKDVTFVIIGPCHEEITYPDNVIYIGKVFDQTELARIYNIADLTVLTSRRETYSMPVAESLCCGTPVVGFCAGGPESIALKQYTEFVDYGDEAALKNAVKNWLSFKNNTNYALIAEKANIEYSSNKMATEYLSVYERICNL